jgi:hypothetical protein
MQRRDSGNSWGKPKTRDTIGGRRATMRVVQAGIRMIVIYEQDPGPDDSGPRTLVYESGDSITRLTRFPEDWRRMTDDELLALPRSQA